jgi:hypothetical protein
MICTMRSKQEYVLEKNEKGKEVPRKVGMAPVQREGMEYEFTTLFDVDMAHQGQTSKDRTGLFDGQIAVLTEETGARIFDWLTSAKAITAPLVEDDDVFKAPPKVVAPKAYCEIDGCGAEMVLVPSGRGYVCKAAPDKTQNHTRFLASDLPNRINKRSTAHAS